MSAGDARLVNPLAERMRRGELGLTLMIRHARTVDIALAARMCGFDGLFFDLQHGVIPEYEISQMAVAAMSISVTPLVRVPEKDYAAALRMLDNIDDIAAVPGVDIVHIGTNDLSTHLGHPGDLTHPDVFKAIERVVKACKANGKFAGVVGLTGGDAAKRIASVVKLGARFITSASGRTPVHAVMHSRV
jgi:2-keto-3-deoxy-L-rhamnonate aldolase RhmA